MLEHSRAAKLSDTGALTESLTLVYMHPRQDCLVAALGNSHGQATLGCLHQARSKGNQLVVGSHLKLKLDLFQ